MLAWILAVPAGAKTPWDDAVAVWHMDGPKDAAGRDSSLKIEGDVELGVTLEGDDLAASRVRQGDGRVAVFKGGWLSAGEGANGELRLAGKAMTLCLRYRASEGLRDTPLLSRHGGANRLVYNLFMADLGAGPAVGFELGTTRNEKPLQLSIPLAAIGPADWHDAIARFDNARVELFIDGVLVDEDWPIGSLRTDNSEPCLIGAESVDGKVKPGFRGMIDHAALWDRAISDDEIVRLSGGPDAVASRRTAILGPLARNVAYWRPGPNANVGDCMPFFHDGTFHLFYLFDRRHHGSKWGLGAHQWAHMSTRDLKSWEQYPLAIPITRQEEGSICTGSVFFHEGVYHAFYATRTLDFLQYLSHATSRDGIHFEKDGPEPFLVPQAGYDPKHYRDPEVFRDPQTGRFHMLVTARLTDGRGGCLAHLESPDLRQWTLKDPMVVTGQVPECPNHFSWNGWYYLLTDRTYWMSREPLGPWTEPKAGCLDVLRVPKTAPFTDGRRIFVSWLPEGGWGGDLVFREVFQKPDGTLGTHFVPEMVPPVEKPVDVAWNAAEGDVQVQAGSVRLKPASGGIAAAVIEGLPVDARIRLRVSGGGSSQTPGDFGLRLHAGADTHGGRELKCEPQAQKVGLTGAEEIDKVDGLDRPFSLEIVLKGGIVDVCVDNRRTLIARMSRRDGDRLVLFARNVETTFDQIEVCPLAK
jgi:hypothetical protein